MSSSKPSKKFKWNLSAIPCFVGWNRLRALRKNLGLTVAELSKKTKTSTATIIMIEAGMDAHTRKVTKNKLAKFFRCKVSDIFPVEMLGAITKEEYLSKKIEQDKTQLTSPAGIAPILDAPDEV